MAQPWNATRDRGSLSLTKSLNRRKFLQTASTAAAAAAGDAALAAGEAAMQVDFINSKIEGFEKDWDKQRKTERLQWEKSEKEVEEDLETLQNEVEELEK